MYVCMCKMCHLLLKGYINIHTHFYNSLNLWIKKKVKSSLQPVWLNWLSHHAPRGHQFDLW